MHGVGARIQGFRHDVADVVHPIGVVAQAADQGVGTGTAIERVVAAAADQGIVAGSAVKNLIGHRVDGEAESKLRTDTGQIRSDDLEREVADVRAARRAGKGLGLRVEREPSRQRAAIGLRDGVGQLVAWVDIGKQADRQRQRKAAAIGRLVVEERSGGCGRVIDIGHRQHEGLA